MRLSRGHGLAEACFCGLVPVAFPRWGRVRGGLLPCVGVLGRLCSRVSWFFCVSFGVALSTRCVRCLRCFFGRVLVALSRSPWLGPLTFSPVRISSRLSLAE